MGCVIWLSDVVGVRSINLNGNTIKIGERKTDYNTNADLANMNTIIINGIQRTKIGE